MSSIIDSSTPSRTPRSFTSTRCVPSQRVRREMTAAPARMMWRAGIQAGDLAAGFERRLPQPRHQVA